MADDPLEPLGEIGALSREMARLDQITSQFGRSLSRALAGGIAQGRSFDDLLRGLGERLIAISLRAAFQPLEAGIASGIGGLMRGVAGALGGSPGGGLGGGLTGALGGAGSSGGGLFGALGAGPVTVNMAITSPDAESFRRSEAQIGAGLARAVSRGRRGL